METLHIPYELSSSFYLDEDNIANLPSLQTLSQCKNPGLKMKLSQRIVEICECKDVVKYAKEKQDTTLLFCLMQ